jgi:[acyl-carrier-protein] S-malonyltransferase
LMTNPVARRLRRSADDVLGYSLMDLYRQAGAGYSEYCQVAFLICCLALIEQAADSFDAEPVACTGPSFGEKPALAYSGVLPFTETVLLVARLARCEEEYFRRERQDMVTQSIAHMPEPALREILDAMTGRHEWNDISCFIDEDFFMVSMRESSLDRFTRDARAAGGLPLYAMWPPMHSSAFAPLRRKAEDEVLGDFLLDDPLLPIVADQDGSVVATADGVRTMLLDSFVRPVRWRDAIGTMREFGVTKVYIPGPDRLFGRVRCTTQSFTVAPINPEVSLRPKAHAMT